MISILVPTRARPDSISRLWQSIVHTAQNLAGIELSLYIDFDDVVSIERVKTLTSPQIKTIVGPRISLSEAWNVLSREATYDIHMQCGDDAVFRTKGWDSLVTQAFDQCPDKILFVYGKDGIQNERMGTLGFLHKNWIQTVGYFLPPFFYSDCTDLWLTDIAKHIKRVHYLPEMYIEHLHPAVGKSELDITHQERLAKLKAEGPLRIYSALKFKRREDAKKLYAFITAYSGKKKRLWG